MLKFVTWAVNPAQPLSSAHKRVYFLTPFLRHFSMIFPMALPAHSGPWPLIQFRNPFSQTVGLLGRVISSSQGRYLNTWQHKHRINSYTHTPNIHSLSGIRTHDPSVQASEDSSCLRSRGYCDQLPQTPLPEGWVRIAWEPSEQVSSFCPTLNI
jgi:hypothetical protein